ncbi:flagellar basal body-associated FliL family protein [Pseudooceanicola marinus]|uniref:flagellar basal body-associated FliL family protein n=1 Tax=Pseudooceanicola marinus TaxID=396013 RepID=UPI001C949F07|nr:flagellar basal body-associated FliL family protein [Pseudooceanicola marinus]MBY5971523.1 flagellar basal body-associated FliL family protein [Ferrimonas balearica]MCA1335900.1 flagellar basal body-associated FliL family protein [Pseudooceanicola marinus]
MKKLLPILLIVLGIGGGAGAGLMLRPAPEVPAEGAAEGMEAPAEEMAEPMAEPPEEELTDREYVKMNNQFIIPVITDEKIGALVVMSISLEVELGGQELVYAREPKLRDAFLQVMFDHANVGGFDGAFTNSNNLDVLRAALFGVARKVLGPTVSDVLITDIARQDA